MLIIKKTIDEIRRAETQAAKTIKDTERKREQLLAEAREEVASLTERQKKDIAGLQESRLARARGKAKTDAGALIAKEHAALQAKAAKMRERLPQAVSHILKAFKQRTQ